jgi:hypothetical protein
MVILKIGSHEQEQEVEIVNEKGTWESGSYKIFNAHFLKGNKTSLEPHNVNSAEYLGNLEINKETQDWLYHGDKLNAEEQKQIAQFIFDYQPPDGVY